MSDQIERSIEWTLSETHKWQNYHDHKERMAWTATAFFVTGIVTVGFILTNAPIVARILVTIGILLVGYMILIFINMQFRMRWRASDNIEGLEKFACYLCSKSVNLPEIIECGNNRFPDHIFKYIKDSRSSIPQKRHIIKQLLSLHPELDSRLETELPSYGIVLIASLTSILSLWLS